MVNLLHDRPSSRVQTRIQINLAIFLYFVSIAFNLLIFSIAQSTASGGRMNVTAITIVAYIMLAIGVLLILWTIIQYGKDSEETIEIRGLEQRLTKKIDALAKEVHNEKQRKGKSQTELKNQRNH